MKTITKQEQQAYQRLLSDDRLTKYQILGIFTYGSQTLGLQDDSSDVDLLVLVLPDAGDLVKGTFKNKEFTYSNGEKIVVWPLPSLLKGVNKMALQTVEAMHRPLMVKDDFNSIYQQVLRVMQTEEAHKEFNKLLYYVLRSYVYKKTLTAKDVAKASIYRYLNQSNQALTHYQQNKLPKDVQDTYTNYKQLDDNLSQDELSILVGCHLSYLNDNEPNNWVRRQQVNTTTEFQELEASIVKYTLLELSKQYDTE